MKGFYSLEEMESEAAELEQKAAHIRQTVAFFRASGKGAQPVVAPKASAPRKQRKTAIELAAEVLTAAGKALPLEEIRQGILAKGGKAKSNANLSSLFSKENKTFFAVSRGVWGLQERDNPKNLL